MSPVPFKSIGIAIKSACTEDICSRQGASRAHAQLLAVEVKKEWLEVVCAISRETQLSKWS